MKRNVIKGMLLRGVPCATLLCAGCATVSTAPAAPATVQAAVNDNMAGLNTANGKLVYDFINLWFNEHNTDAAFEKYVSHDNYMNHAVYSSSVNRHPTFAEEKVEEARAVPPGSHFEFKQLICQGSLVVAHILATPQPGAVGDEMVMILRVRDGKITDHWDIHEALKPDSAVFVGLDR